MSDETAKQDDSRRDGGTVAAGVAGVAGAVALALCCGGGLIAAGLGLGALAAFLVNPWFLFAVVATTAGIIYWRANCANATCDIKSPGGGDRS